MNMNKVIIVSGSQGGMGSAIECELAKNGYRVVGIDSAIQSSHEKVRDYMCFDLATLVSESDVSKFRSSLLDMIGQDEVHGIVNNAAVQILGPAETLRIEDFWTSLQVNCIAAFALTKAVLPELRRCHGTVLNIGSIHSRLTKAGFVAYATSKAAIEGLTRALAVDLGSSIKVCAISPGAIGTKMLEQGFEDTPEKLSDLKALHPTGEIGTPQEVATLARMLLGGGLPFSNGSVWTLDGGIGARLHDP